MHVIYLWSCVRRMQIVVRCRKVHPFVVSAPLCKLPFFDWVSVCSHMHVLVYIHLWQVLHRLPWISSNRDSFLPLLDRVAPPLAIETFYRQAKYFISSRMCRLIVEMHIRSNATISVFILNWILMKAPQSYLFNLITFFNYAFLQLHSQMLPIIGQQNNGESHDV